MPILDAKFFATAVLTQRETGGNLSEVLDNLAGVIRERFKVKRQVRVVTAHGRITGWILAALPPVLAVILCFVSPDHMKTMISDPLGVRMLVIGGTMQVIGTLIIRQLVNIRYSERADVNRPDRHSRRSIHVRGAGRRLRHLGTRVGDVAGPAPASTSGDDHDRAHRCDRHAGAWSRPSIPG